MTDYYQQAGVDIEAGQQAVALMKAAIQSTFTTAVLSDVGNFGGLYDAAALKALDAPLLVASTDGVGTKTKVAAKLNRWDSIGQDLVNHCVNDILVQGARPLFFLDYLASDRLDPQQMATIVTGMATACRAVGCALLGGETAEMPGVYVSGEVDIVGTVIGAVDRQHVIDGHAIQAGDAIIALASTGLHTNGYSLARYILAELDWTVPHNGLGMSIGEALLAVHRCYLEPIQRLQNADIAIHGLAHITGGGVVDNLPRILSSGLGAKIERGTWSVPPIFTLLQTLGSVDESEMYRVFNMGLGMLVVLPADQVPSALSVLGEGYRVGSIVADPSGVQVVG